MKSSSNAPDPTLGFIQYLEHLTFLEYLLGLHMKGVGLQMAKGQFLMSSKNKNEFVN